MKSWGVILLLLPFSALGEETFLDYMPNGLIDENSLKIIRNAPFTSSNNEEQSASMPDIPFGYGLAGQQDISSQEQDNNPPKSIAENKDEASNGENTVETSKNAPKEISLQEAKELNYQPEDLSAPPVYKEPVKVNANLDPVQANIDTLKATVLSPSISVKPAAEIQETKLPEPKIKIPPRIESAKTNHSPQEIAGSQRFLPSGNWQGSTQVFSSENLKRH